MNALPRLLLGALLMTNWRIDACTGQRDAFKFCSWCGAPMKHAEFAETNSDEITLTCSAGMFHENVFLKKCDMGEDCDHEPKFESW